jgi:hypothetical protein
MPAILRRAALAGAALVSLATLAAPATAQSDILLRLRSGTPLGDRFRVDSAGGFVAKGALGVGIIPQTGAGERLMWYPFKASFRAGTIGSGGTQWDDPNMGFYSWAGGYNTMALGLASFAMGYQTTALGSYSIALGYTDNADGTGAVALGYRSTADADYSMAFGYRASTNGHTGAKVFGDASTTDSIEAVANNEFAVRAAGGFRFRSNATLTNGCNIAAGGASITCASSKTLKENFVDVDGEDILARMRTVPVNTWQYKEEVGHPRRMGPFAEDFARAFGLGNDTLAIGHLDIDGVNFAGIKALDARTAGLRTENEVLTGAIAAIRVENERLKEENEALRARDSRMEERIARLEALLAASPRP